jgi:hypothetical protein
VLRHLRAGLFSLALLAIVGGALILATKSLIILPLLNWIRSLPQEQMELYISIYGRLLIAVGIFLFLISSLMFWLKRRIAAKRS